MTKTKLAFLKASSAVTANLSAAWFGLALVTPNFVELSGMDVMIALTRDVVFGILWLIITISIERIIS